LFARIFFFLNLFRVIFYIIGLSSFFTIESNCRERSRLRDGEATEFESHSTEHLSSKQAGA